LSHILSQASPVQLVASASQNRRVVDPVFDRPSGLFVVQHVRAKTSPTHTDTPPTVPGGVGRAVCNCDFSIPGHPDRRERAAVEPEAVGSREESKREPVTRERV